MTWPAAKAAFAKSAPIPRPAPVMNQIFFSLTTSPYSIEGVSENTPRGTRSQALRRARTRGVLSGDEPLQVPSQALEDDDAASAEAAGLHGAVGVGRPLRRVLGGDTQRDGTARGQVAQLVQPVGTRECFHHHDRLNSDVALGWTAVPASHGNVRAAVANRRERVATQD